MSKHTAGPWRSSFKSEVALDGDMHFILDHSGLFVGMANAWTDDGDDREEAENNARLISAAPELLEACQAFLAYRDYKDYAAAADMARAAIAKALDTQ